MIRLFCGYDKREAIGFHVFVASVLEHASVSVAITPLDDRGVPQGSNAFTLARFLVPWYCGYKGWAIFADACDMLMLGDIAELAALYDSRQAVQVVKHADYATRHPRKYVGTAMECDNRDYSRKNWASLMLINCEHRLWARIDPAHLHRATVLGMLQMPAAVASGAVGALPDCWNRLVDEGQPAEGAKLLHWTAGIPAFPRYAGAPCADVWTTQRERMEATA